MNRRFDDLWSSAAHDGASCPVGLSATKADLKAEVDQLMSAWFHERTDRIECSLILGRAGRLLSALLADGRITPRKRREACRVIRAIRKQLDEEARGDSPD